MVSAIPKWVWKRYALLWKKFGTTPFTFEKAQKELKTKTLRFRGGFCFDFAFCYATSNAPPQRGFIIAIIMATDIRVILSITCSHYQTRFRCQDPAPNQYYSDQ